MTNPDNIVRVRARNGGRASVYEANGWAQAYTGGLLEGSGVIQNTSADMNVLVGGTSSKPDVVLAENLAGYKIALDLVGQHAVAVTAPATNSRVSAIVAYTDDLSLPTTENTVTGSPASCGLIVVNGTASASPSEPTDSQIRSAITADGATGSQAAYVIIATVLVASDTTTITNSLITINNSVVKSDKMNFAAYSTSETDTGQKWIDGKTIYRKTYTGTVSVTANQRTNVDFESDATFMDSLIGCGGFMDTGTGTYGRNIIPWAETNSNGTPTEWCEIYRAGAGGQLRMTRWSSNNRTNLKYAVWVEYTKND